MSSPGPPRYTGEYPPPYVPPDQVGAEPEPPRPSWLRRHGLAVVAGLLVVVVAIGVGGFVVVNQISDAYDDPLYTDCEWSPSPADTYSEFTELIPVPNLPGLSEAHEAFRRELQSPRYHFEVRQSHSKGDWTTSIVRDGDQIEFRHDDGTTGRVSRSGFLLGAADSGFWLESCSDPSLLAFASDDADCIERSVDGEDVVVTYRQPSRESGPCSETANRLDHRVVIRDGRLRRWSYVITLDSEPSSRREWIVREPESLDGPMPWQVIPAWFVRLAA